MTLIEYLRSTQTSDATFAQKVGRSRWAVRKWMYRQRVPRAAELAAIARLTDGKVTANDFMPPVPAPSETQGAA